MSGKEIVLIHNCPVCKLKTTEVFLKSYEKLSTQSVCVLNYDFIKELDGKPHFERIEQGNYTFLICPNCGTVLSGDICEKEIDEEPI